MIRNTEQKQRFSRSHSAAKAIVLDPKRDLLKKVFLVIICAAVVMYIARYEGPRYDHSLIALKKLSIPAAPPKAIMQELGVREAYKLVPVDYVDFRPAIAKMPAAERDYLVKLFSLTDLSTIEKVRKMRVLERQGDYAAIADNHSEILRQMAGMRVPPALEKVHLLILNAVEEQRRYFEQWRTNPTQRFSTSHPLVGSSHRKLVEAYQILIDTYDTEDQHNKQSFYSHLCALSFI